MSGALTSYSFDVTQPNSFFKSVCFEMSRYAIGDNLLTLTPTSRDFEANKHFLKSALPNLCHFLDFDERQLRKPLRERVSEVCIDSCCVREALDRLQSLGHLNSADRAQCGQFLRAFEENSACSRENGSTITPNQKEIIEAMVDPYADDLKTHLSPEELEKAIDDADKTMRRWTNLTQEQFNTHMPPIKKKHWSAETRQDVLTGLYVVGGIVAGTANLERAFGYNLEAKKGVKLPSRSLQKQVVMQYLGITHPSQEERTRYSDEMSLIQKRVVEARVTPCIDDLKKYMSLAEIESAIKDAEIEAEHSDHCRKTFDVQMSHVLKENWSPDVKEQVLDALKTIGQVMNGTQYLGRAYLEAAPTIPYRNVESRLVWDLVRSGQEPSPAKKARTS